MSCFFKMCAASLLAMMAMPALAQQDPTSSKPEGIVLQAKEGSVMTSTGGAFESASVGKQLVSGESMMLTEGSKATVAYSYDNGARKCVEHYVGPSTVVIDDNCTKAAWVSDGSQAKSAMIIVGAGLLGAAVLESMDEVAPGPLSAGSR